MLEKIELDRRKRDIKNSEDDILDESNDNSLLEDGTNFMNPNEMRRDQFDNEKLSEMEEYYLTEIEQLQ